MSDQQYPPPSGGGMHTPILYGLVVALMGATGFLYYQLNQTRTDLTTNRDQLLDEVAKLRETSAVSTQTSRRTAEDLKAQLAAARTQASQAVGQARVDADKHAEALASALQKTQQEQAQKVSAVTADLSQVKDQTVAANTKIGQVSTDVGAVKSDVAATRSELEKTIATLKSAQGDMGVQSGLIATNGKELAALRALGERNYIEFTLSKGKKPQKVGDITILLKKTDPKRNSYSIEVTADDKTVDKKDKNVNEPVQFLLSKATQPYELVVNDVKKDVIKGYLAAPKVLTQRN